MFVIETELGRFVGETEREAKRLLRKAERERAKQEAKAAANRKLATQMAEARGYIHYRNHFEDYRPPYSWLVKQGDPSFPATQDEFDGRRWEVRVSASATISLYGYQPVAVLLRPSGDVDLLWTQDMDVSRRTYVMAIGYCQDQVGTASLPIELFPVERFEEQPAAAH